MSLQRRLVLTILCVAPLLWLMSAGVATWQTHRSVDELYDSQLTLFARQLLAVDIEHDGDDGASLPRTRKLIRGGNRGHGDEDELGLAVWDASGKLLISDGGRHHFEFSPDKRGFYSEQDRHHDWRVFYLPSPDGEKFVAVGQRDHLRHGAVRHVVLAQLFSWLLPLPLLVGLLVFGVRRALAPVRQLGSELAARRIDDHQAVSTRVPDELTPLIDALNQLFARIAETLNKERRFTSDAAHELRSPLTALRVQAEVARLASDPAVANRALDQLMVGIDRAGRLIEQLLALSRLDRQGEGLSLEKIDWSRVVAGLTSGVLCSADPEGNRLHCEWCCDPAQVLPLAGDETLISLMLRNLLDNALKYSPAEGRVTLRLEPHQIAVLDEGEGVAGDALERIRERFYRPPGQTVPGSGLGLSIVEEVARLHGLSLQLGNRPEGGFIASLQPATKGHIPEASAKD